ncbi:MAG: carbohydrate kinase, partial [Gluconacetobacter diazotrophicus]|nr:carbohydrate kinase [Gluconacetobacter diazotrophicus]
MRGRFIGIDAGGTMTKAALFDETGTELACARKPNTMLFPAPGHTERDPDRMWQAACAAIRAVLDESGTDPADVLAVATTGYGSGLYLVDDELRPVRPGIVSTDSRAAALVAGWEADGTATACAPLVQQRFWAGQAAPLLAWLAREEPEVIARTRSVLWCKDFLRARLCGEISTDPTDAGIAGLIDVTTGQYATDLFAPIGMGAWADKLPPIGPSSEVCGTVTPEAARLCGLRAGTPVVRGVVDVAAASLASGMADPSTLTVVAGTFSINQTLHATPRTSTWPFLQCAYPVGNSFLATEGAPTSAGNLEWFCRVMLDAEAERAAARGKTIYEVCEHLVGDALSRRSDILFFPFLFGGGPRNAPAGIVGLTASGSLSDVVGAIYEGIAFAHRLDIDRLLSGPDAAAP